MSKPNAWMPLYIGDYLRKTMRLNAEQHGAYLLLLMAYWQDGPLPDDDDQLAAIARLDGKGWAKVSKVVRPYFRSEGGQLHHDNAERLKTEAVEKYERRSKAGSNNVRTRYQQPTNGTALEYEPPPQSQSQPHSSNEENSRRDADASEPEDLKGKIFGTALDWLASKSGKSKNSLRSLAGKWIKDHGEEATLKAMNEAAKNSPLDPVPYIEKVFAAKPKAAEPIQADPLAKAKTAAWAVKGGHRPLSVSPSDVRAAVAENLITADQAKQAGWSL